MTSRPRPAPAASPASPAPAGLPRLVSWLLAAAVVLVVAAGSLTLRDPGASAAERGAPTSVPAPSVAAAPQARSRSVTPGGVLAAWDAARSRAWADGDVTALRRLYTDDASAGVNDASMLRRWTARGLRVTGLRLRVLRLVVRSRSPHRMVLRVTDREVGATARGRGRVTMLPIDRPSTRRIVLRHGGGSWRVASVVDV